ncbi:hypothetical protein [Photobacterium ganghwense]|nr:hypothetical protein [Photobacterium ganghwense]QSV17150.1 hypothetical protein FH974_19625 [Photobacterium ganghwense]
MSIIMCDEYLSVEEELNRKVNDTLIDILTKRDGKRISPAQARERIAVVHDVAMGLVNDDLSKLIEAALREAGTQQENGARRLFPVLLRKDSNMLSLDIDECNPKRLVLKGVVGGSFTDKSSFFDAETDAFRATAETLSKLLKSGWSKEV